MAWNYFFKDRSGAQNGPVSLDELVALAKSGRIAPDCLVWSEGGEPVAASRFPGLAEIFGQSPTAPTPEGQGPLVPDFPGWGLIWRAYVFMFALLTLVFAPLAGRWYYRFIASRVSLPNGRRLFIDAPLSSCWWIFLGLSLAILTPVALIMSVLGDPGALQGHDPAALQAQMAHFWPIRIVANLAAFVLHFMIIRWFVGRLRSDDGALNVKFGGGVWGFFGWNLLLVLSVFTIIGWAWVLAGMMRWLCRNVSGTHAFAFVGSGWDLLWRTLVAFLGLGFFLGLFAAAIGLSSQHGHHGGAVGILALLGFAAFVYLLGRITSWFANWLVSRIVVTPGAAAPAVQQAA